MGTLSLDSNKLMRFNPSEVEFTENGKLGWKTDKGEILIPAEYDQIEKGENVLYVRKGNDYELYFGNSCSEGLVIFMKTAHFSWKTRNSDGVKVTRS